MIAFEQEVLETEQWFDSPRFAGILRLYAARQVVEHVVERGPVHEQQQRLRYGLGERPEPRSLAADEDHRLHVRTLSRKATSSARARRATQASGRSARPHPRARCLRKYRYTLAECMRCVRRERPVDTPPS